MIPGFLEGLSYMSHGDKAALFIPCQFSVWRKGGGNSGQMLLDFLN
jgi:FKBP-type peptidyl-prolyl cis-trans isomerase